MTSVAIVQDNYPARKILVEMINNTPGYRCVCVCSNSREASSEVPRQRPHVVLMDIQLPDESGIVCTARLTGKLPGLQVIVAVYADTELILQALRAGASGCLLKGAAPDEIIRSIAEVCAGGAPLSPAIARLLVRSFHPGLAVSRVDGLTLRQTEIVGLLAQGLSNKEIGQRIEISAGTVRNHLGNIFKKLHVRCRTEAAAKFLDLKHGATTNGE